MKGAEYRSATAPVEARTIDVNVEALDTRGRTVHGYAALYNVESDDLGGFRERIAPGAFADVLDADVRALLNHDPNEVLGRTRSGTLRLFDDPERGLRFELDLPDSPLGQNVREAVRRGDLDGASFRFVPADESWDGDLRTVEHVAELHDITLATYPAYPAASVALRSRSADRNGERTTASRRSAGLAVDSRNGSGGPAPVEQRVREALASTRKGENRALTTASTLAPGELSSYLWDRLRASSVALASGLAVVTTERDTVTYPRLTADVAPGWVAEATEIPAGDPTLDSITATPRKLAHRVEFSNEVIDDSDPPALDVVRDHLITTLGLKLDIGIFEGTGTAPQIRGLKNVAGIQTVSMGANGAALTDVDPFVDAITLLSTVNASAAAIVMHPRTWQSLSKLKEDSGNNKPLLMDSAPTQGVRFSIYGVPVFLSSQLSITETQGSATNASSAYVYQASQILLVRRQDVEVELDRSRLFNFDMSELRGKLRADLIVPNPTTVVRVAGIIPA